MDAVRLKLDKREVTGKAVKRLRQSDIVPAVVHDHGAESLVVQAEYQAMVQAYKQAGKHHPVELTVDGKAHTALIKAATFDPKKNRLSHVVFNAVKQNEKVTAEIPIKPKFAEGNDSTPAERVGLIVLHNMDVVEVEALAKNLPDELYFDAEKLIEVGDHATVGDLLVPDGVEVKADPAQAVSTVYEPSALQAANEDAGGGAKAETEQAPSDESVAEEGSTQQGEDSSGAGNKK